VGEGVCVYPEVHIRAGEGGRVVLGEKCVILDGAVIKATAGKTIVIGDGSMVSYNAVVIDAEVGAGCLVGRESVVLHGAGLADGTVLNDGTVVPPGGGSSKAVLLKGFPPEEVREISEDEVIKMLEVNQRLRDGAREYCLHAAMKRI
jgi:carbonic anhydrase/acetyltransferase-like protein (isoleucine patch superfamily)